MSTSFRILKAAVREFVNRPADEDIDPNQLRDLVELLESQWEMLYESPEERAAANEALAEAIREIDATMKRSPS